MGKPENKKRGINSVNRLNIEHIKLYGIVYCNFFLKKKSVKTVTKISFEDARRCQFRSPCHTVTFVIFFTSKCSLEVHINCIGKNITKREVSPLKLSLNIIQ